jgi:hypothetical protein
MMKTLGLLAAAAAVASLTLVAAAPALAAPPAPACDLRLTNVVNDAHPLLGSAVRFTVTATVRCNFDAVVTVDDPLPPGLAKDPPDEQLRFQFNAPRDRQVTRAFTVGDIVPGADDCGAHFTSTASAAAQVPNGEGAVAFKTASVTLTSRCMTPGLPATGRQA